MRTSLRIAAATTLLLSVVAVVPTHALDTDVYLKAQTTLRSDLPNVLIILDNSGSMSGNVPSTRPAYDPAVDYCNDDLDTVLGMAGANGGKPSSCSSKTGRVYFSFTGSPPSYTSTSWFASGKNKCLDSSTAFTSAGKYGSAKIAMWKSGSNWKSLKSKIDGDMTYVDCQPDGTSNGLASGDNQFPRSSTSTAYTATASQAFNWTSYTTDATPTLYTSNYMFYWHNTQIDTTRQKINIAKDAVNEIINSNKNVRFGLMVFNNNSSGSGYDGGRVIYRVDDMTDARRTAMSATVNAITAATWTPLAETMWEAYRYFAGLTLQFGNLEAGATPTRDLSAEVGGGTPPETYLSPFAYACQKSYVILVTDGDPTNDTAANAGIKSLTGNNSCDASATNGYSCLDTLTGWMNTHDLLGSLAGNQSVTTYTVGFGSDISAAGLTLLQSTATKGGGTYTSAIDADQLNAALQGYLINILSETTSFTAPSLSINAFNKQYNNNDVYLSVFKPESKTAWDGNVKKYKLCTSADINSGYCGSLSHILDQNNVKITDINNNIIDSAQSFWSAAADGSTVNKGGAGEHVPVPAGRVMYTYYGDYGLLVAPSSGVKVAIDASNPFYQAVVADPTLLGLTAGATSTEVDTLINWMLGQDSYDKDSDGVTTDTRWAVADPLHSRAVPITYGKDGSGNAIIKLFVGANDGTIRILNNSTGAEEWAFVPQELYATQYAQSQDATGDHLYGMDGTPSFWLLDINNDGIIDPSAGDRLRMFISMRRGGRNIYAFDVTPISKLTNQSSTVTPKLMWVIKGGSGDFTQLGQAWSDAQVVRVSYQCPSPAAGSVCDDGNPITDDSKSRVVLVFSGGYDTNQDNAIPAGTDSVGNAIYLVDPLSGKRIWWAGGSASATLTLSKMKYSIPSDPILIDTNGDGKVDRLYVGDMGGQLWRIDLGKDLSQDSNGGTAGFVFADVGCTGGSRASDCTATTEQNRRKFFYPPEVAPTRDTQYSASANYDLVAIGTGDREDPLDLLTDNLVAPKSKEAVHNRIYAFRDYNYLSGAPASTPNALSESDLYDATTNDFGTLSGAALQTEINNLKNKKGWYIDLKSLAAMTVPNGLTTNWIGEKVLARTKIYEGLLLVTTFTPANDTNASTTCSANAGVATEYVLDALNAAGKGDFQKNGTLSRKGQVGDGIPSEVVIIFRPDGTTGLINAGGKGGAPVEAVGVGSNSAQRHYWFEE